jgi:hypothetical protein
MKRLLMIALLTASAWIAQGQKTKQGGLILLKKHPVTIQQGYKNPCSNTPLIRELSDSLAKEGFELLDSAKAMSKSSDFFKHIFGYSHRHNYTKSVEEVKAYMDREVATSNLYQQLAVYDYSCIDSVQNYTISLYMFPRAKDTVSQSFTLPKDSPYSVASIILSLVRPK